MAHISNSNDHTHITPDLLHVMKEICSLSRILFDNDPDGCANMTQTEIYQTLWLSPAKDVAHSLMTTMNSKFPYASPFDRIQRSQAAWPVIYSFKWTNVSDIKDFQRNSTHCMFAKLHVSHNTQHLTFFIKAAPRDMVMARSIDNPMTDSVNGKILHKLTQAIFDADTKRRIQAHTIMYETSFNCPIVYDETVQQDTLPLQKMMNIYHEACPFSVSFPQQQDFVFASVFEYIPGESVSDVLKKHTNGIDKILNSLSDFWHTMGVLGMDYGMIHNDLHAGNVFYNSQMHKLMLIDYGQMTFPYEIQDVIGDHLDNIVEHEAWHNNIKPLTYEHLIGKRVVAYKDSAHFYTTHILDLATFMTNIYYHVSKTLGSQWHFFNELIKFDKHSDNIQINLNITSCITEWYNAMLSVNDAKFLSTAEKRSMNLIGEGVFFMSLIMIYVLSAKRWLTPSIKKLDISRKVLADAKIMHYGFQVNHNIINQYVNTTKICQGLLQEMSNMTNSAHIITHLFDHTMLLQKMKTPNPNRGQVGGNNIQMVYTEPTAKEWVQRYKYLERKDVHDDTSLQSLAHKDDNHVSITSEENKPKQSSSSMTRANSVLRQSFSALREPVMAYGGKKKRTNK